MNAQDLPAERRFVVLRHEDREGIHFDLMIENGDRLATWKLPVAPEFAGRGDARTPHGAAAAIVCRRIGEHRRVYLDYEGPISGDRGHVARHDDGTCRVISQPEPISAASGVLTIEFTGRHLRGRFELARTGDQESDWSFRGLDA